MNVLDIRGNRRKFLETFWNKALKLDREELENVELSNMIEVYLENLPKSAISRCPFTGELFEISIDKEGLDGLWWNSDAPKRKNEKFIDSFYAMDGALKLYEEVEQFPFLCTPGPEIPYIIPRLLEYDQIKAVVSQIKIGKHTAYPVLYFSDPMLYYEKRVNDWGTNYYWEDGNVIEEILTPGNFVSLELETDRDYDLEKWIKNGKLLWIAQEDINFKLHSYIDGCPYLDIIGSENDKFIQNGEVWEDDWNLDENSYIESSEFDKNYFEELIKSIEKEI